MAKRAAKAVEAIAANGGKMIFVGTKKQAMEPIKEAATKSGQFYVTKRWLGGMLTNFKTIKSSIDKLKRFEKMIETNQLQRYSKKEIITISKEAQKLDRNLGGLRNMNKVPQALFIVDVRREHLAIADAKRLGIPVIAIVDTNANPNLVDYPIPANDDAIRSIRLFTIGITEACIEGNSLREESMLTEDGETTTKVEKKRPSTKAPEAKKPFHKKPFAAKKRDDDDSHDEADE